MAKDQLMVACTKCRKPFWWLAFWKRQPHCMVCHDTRWIPQSDVRFGAARGMQLVYSKNSSCRTCNPNT